MNFLHIPGQDVDLRTMERPLDPRMARMDQDLRGPAAVTTVAPPIPPVILPPIPTNPDPRTALPGFGVPDT